jgi:peptide/nickel transport system substrate-binding protein
MRHSPLRRGLSAIGAAVLVAALLFPAAAPAAAQERVTLRVGTTQDLDSMNPFDTALVVGFEVFTLNYELLVEYDENLEPAPGFADSWEVSDDGTVYTFNIPEGKLWSDGEPATAEDARWTYQFILDGVASDVGSVGLGYLDPYLVNAGAQTVEAPDAQTLVITLDRPNERILQPYIPILPKHIWEDVTVEDVSEFTNNPPVVGSGPYQAVEWATGQYVRHERNPNWNRGELAADEVIIQIFGSTDTMAQALRAGELDYANGLNPDQFDAFANDADIETVAGTANGYTELGFNTYEGDIPNGGQSTEALKDPAFRDALGYAIDRELLVDRVLGGYGDPGDTQVPPFQTRWHTPAADPRTFDLDEARSRLDAAGYALDANGRRLDQEGNPINLRLYFPDSDGTYPQSAQFIQGWFGELGINVTPQQFTSDTLIDIMLPPEAGDEYVADFDLFIWGWAGDVDPNSLLEIFKCTEIGNSSDSMYCNEEYDRLFDEQNLAAEYDDRKALIDQMQEIWYRDAPYHILFYDANLHAYRTDRFEGWTNQPDDGVPLFGYGSFGYTQLRVAGAEPPSPTPETPDGATPGAATPDAGGNGGTGEQPTAGGDNMLLIVGLVAVVAVVAVGLILARRRGGPRVDEE